MIGKAKGRKKPKATVPRLSRSKPKPSQLPDKESEEKCRQHQQSIDSSWEQELETNKHRVEQFPELPSQTRIYDSISDYRGRMSTSNLAQSICGVCGEQLNHVMVRRYAAQDEFLGDHTLHTMKALLTATYSKPTFAEGAFAFR